MQGPSDLEMRGVNWLTGTGAVVLLLGVGFGFQYAVDAGWIGAQARVAVGMLAGLLILGAADWLQARAQPVLVHALAAVGLGVLYLATWAAHGLYGLVPAGVAFAGFVAITISAVAAALRYRAEVLLGLALAGGLLAPAVVDAGAGHALFRWLDLLAVTGGVLAVALRRRFTTVAVLALVSADLGGAVLLAGQAAPWQAAIAAGTGIAFAVAGGSLLRRAPTISWLFSAQGIALLVTGIGLRFSGPGSTLLWAGLGVGVLVLGLGVRSPVHRGLGLGLLALALAKAVMLDLWRVGAGYRTAVFLGVGGLLLATGFLYYRSTSTPWRR